MRQVLWTTVVAMVLILIQTIKVPAAAPATQPASAGKLDFRIAAEIGPVDKPTDNLLPRKLAEKLIHQLSDKGPQGKYDRPNGFDWFETTFADTDRLLSGIYENRRYVLLMASEPHTMLADQNGRRTWGLKGVYLDKNNAGQTAIRIDFDVPGAERFGKFTGEHLPSANHRYALAVLIDDMVIAVPTIAGEIRGSGIIEGGPNGYDAATAKRIMESLRQGMPPVPSSPAPASRSATPATTQPAATQASTEPVHTVSFRLYESGHPDQAIRWMVKGGRKRIESPDGTLLIQNASQDRGIVLDPGHKTAMILKLVNTFEDYANIEKMTDPGQSPVVPLGMKQVAGREADGIQFKVGDEQRTIWRDAATRRPVQIEIILPLPPKPKPLHLIYSEIVFDAALDDGLFALQPPPGYKLKEGDTRAAPGAEFSLNIFGDLFDWWSEMGVPPAKLDFRIAAEIGPVDKPTDDLLPPKLAEELIRRLNEKGPQGKYDRPNGFDWFETTEADANQQLVSGDYEKHRYVLLMTNEPYTMLADQNGRRVWGLEAVYLDKDREGQTCIGFEFDAAGAKRFGKLTGEYLPSANHKYALAILIDGKVITAPSINGQIGSRAIIEGGRNGFDQTTAKRLVAALGQGMPAVPSSPAATEPAASRPSPP